MKNKVRKMSIGIIIGIFVVIAVVFMTGKDDSQLENKEYFTRGEWVQMLLAKTETKLLEETEFYFSDTVNSNYGLAVETAHALGFLPKEDYGEEKIFRIDKTADREFAAYTVYHILGFYGTNQLVCKDCEEISYPEEVALIVYQGFLTLTEEAFLPKQQLSVADKELIFEKIDEFTDFKNISEEDEVCDITYLEEVVEIEIPEGCDYTQLDALYRLQIKKDVDISKIREGGLLIVTQGVGYEQSDLYRVNTVIEENNQNIIECIRPNLDEIVGKYEVIEKTRVLPAEIGVEEDVTYEYIALQEERGGMRSYDLEKHYESIGGIRFKFLNKKIGGEENGLTLSGSFSIEFPELLLKVRGEGSKLEEVSFALSHEEKINGLSLQWNSSIEESKRIKNDKIKVGELHAPINPLLKVKVTIYLELGISGEISVSYEVDSLTEFQYKNGTFRTQSTSLSQTTAPEIKTKVKIGAVPNIALNLLGCGNLFGADMPIGFSADASITVHKDVEPILTCYDLSAYLYFSIENDTESLIGKILKETGLSLEKDIWTRRNSPWKVASHTENDEWKEACTYVGTNDRNYALSKQSYEEALQVSAKYYVVKENGFYGMVTFDGTAVVPIQYTSYKKVAENEIEFCKNTKAYVYDVNTGESILEYAKKEAIEPNKHFESFHRAYDENFDVDDSLFGEILNIQVVAALFYGEEWSYLYRQYQNGILMEKILTDWIYNYGEDSFLHWVVTFKKADTGEIIYSGYSDPIIVTKNGTTYIGGDEAREIFWFGGFSEDITEQTAIFFEEAIDGTDNLVLISATGYERKDFSYALQYDCRYDNGWIKKYQNGVLLNTQTHEIVNMPMKGSPACGNGEYYAILANDNYVICKGDTILRRACKSVDFINDKYIVFESAAREYIYMDYNGNELLLVNEYGGFVDGKALVCDSNGVYYINESLNKISDYIYEGIVEDCDTGTIQKEGKWFLIGEK